MKTGAKNKSNLTTKNMTSSFIVSRKLESLHSLVNDNQTANLKQSDGINFMKKFPSILNMAIRDFEEKIRERSGDRYLNGFSELAELVNLSESTIRHYTNEFNPEFPTVINLIRICKAIDDYRPIEFLNDYKEVIK